MNTIFNRDSASFPVRRLLDEYGAEQYTEHDDGSMTVLGDGWATTVPASEVETAVSGRLVDGWQLVRRSEYPKRTL